ncbi:hypothetical protein M422DRAFT_51316 [Sphaerobolus stellatus SS14]|uniref:Uncharacterized protein n=1 Tax=Sphaerobolus stellatus (strain SS14) TaxID=990650 RepID=A0A0C9TZX1_SPHS4|nr:hypothetical protein M422DRAFT_51316 [Sphaerobolus stellatus SS14]
MSLDRSKVAAARPLHREIEHSFRHILNSLNDTLNLIKCRPISCSEDDPYGYAIDPNKYQVLQEKINEAISDQNHIIQELPIEMPMIPTWFGEIQTSAIWDKQEAELFCVCLREDVENFLAHLWILLLVWKGNYLPSHFTFISPDDVPCPDSDDLMELYMKQTRIVRKVIERRSQSDEDLMLASNRKKYAGSRIDRSLPDTSPEPELGDYQSFAEIRQRQTSTHSIRPRHSAVSFVLPPSPNQANLATSETLNEMFNDRKSRSKRRETLYGNIQSTPVRRTVDDTLGKTSIFSTLTTDGN